MPTEEENKVFMGLIKTLRRLTGGWLPRLDSSPAPAACAGPMVLTSQPGMALLMYRVDVHPDFLLSITLTHFWSLPVVLITARFQGEA